MLRQWRNDIREYEAACLIAELVGEARVILNVGPSWGRDFYALTERRKQVVNMDIAPQRHLPATVRGDASRGFPFPAHFFDAVIMPEVLEHLIEDWIALEEARRVLKDDGRLVVTVPYLQRPAPLPRPYPLSQNHYPPVGSLRFFRRAHYISRWMDTLSSACACDPQISCPFEVEQGLVPSCCCNGSLVGGTALVPALG